MINRTLLAAAVVGPPVDPNRSQPAVCKIIANAVRAGVRRA